jgi:hypothetical protein
MAKDDILTIVEFIRDKVGELPTREEFRAFMVETAENFVAVRAELRDVRREIAAITTRLDKLEAAVRDIRGYAKEIDALRDEIKLIKRHLGLATDITA